MNPTQQESQPAIGFITIVKNRELGIMGGYLILNRNGRPVEFHCTAPIRATRSQHILFGPTLEPYIYGEQIGRALALRASVLPRVILTDKSGVVALRPLIKAPVMFTEIPQIRKDSKEKTENPPEIESKNENQAQSSEILLRENNIFSVEQNPETAEKADSAADIGALKGKIEPKFDSNIIVPEHSLLWNGVLLHPDKKYLADSAQTEQFLKEMEIEYDLSEPFDRIREAIYEAQKRAA